MGPSARRQGIWTDMLARRRHRIDQFRWPKSTSAFFVISLGPMAFDRSVMNRCPGQGMAEIERVK